MGGDGNGVETGRERRVEWGNLERRRGERNLWSGENLYIKDEAEYILYTIQTTIYSIKRTRRTIKNYSKIEEERRGEEGVDIYI